MSCPEEILMQIRATLVQSGQLSYVKRIQLGPYPPPDSSDPYTIAISPSDVVTDPKTWPTQAKFIAVITATNIVSKPHNAYHDPARNTVMDMFEHIRLALHANPTLDGICNSMFLSSAKFDIKKHSWGAKERLDTHPQYGCEIYLTIDYDTDLPI